MYRTRLPRLAAATAAGLSAVAVFSTLCAPHRLDAQQSQSTTTPTPQTERHGYGYGVASVVVPAPQAVAPQTAAPAAPPAPQVSDNTDEAGVHLDRLMTLREWDATGVARLRPDERVALESWVQKYRSVVLDSAVRASESETAASPGAVSNGDVAGAPAQSTAPAQPMSGYNSAYAAPAAPYTGPPAAQQAPPTYAPAYSSGAPLSSNTAGAYSGPATNAPVPTYAYPQQPAQSNFQTAPQGYQPSYQQPGYQQPTYQQPNTQQPGYQQPGYQQPGYQPAPAPVPQTTPPATAPAAGPQQGYAPQSYAPAQGYPPQSYQTYAQPFTSTPSGPPAAGPSVPYPTTASTPQAAQNQGLAPAAPAPYGAALTPAATPGPSGAVVKTGLAVKVVQGDSRFVSLTDGSMWDVYAADRAEAGVWRAQDPVYVRLATTTVTGGYDREIVNATRNVLIRVKFAGQLSNGAN